MQTDPATVADGTDSELDSQASAELVGQVLQRERTAQNLSEKEVADRLHITMHYVRALESNRFDKLPGAVFAKGYIKSYALLLGLDESQTVARYEQDVKEAEENSASQAELQPRRRRTILPGLAAVAALAVVIAGFLFWPADSADAPAQTGVAETAAQAATGLVSEARETAPEDAAASLTSRSSARPSALPPNLSTSSSSAAQLPGDVPPEPDPDLDIDPNPSAIAAGQEQLSLEAEAQEPGNVLASAAVEEAPADSVETNELTTEADETIIAVVSEGADVLQIRFLGESWVEVNDGSEQQIYRDLRGAGDVLEITGTAPFNILLGDAPFTRLTLNGAEIDVSDEIRIDNSARLTVGL